jgi:Bacterial Ig-like domain (group 3)
MRPIRKVDPVRVRSARSASVRSKACAVAGGRDRGRNRLKPELVQFEERQLLATFTVSSTLDTVTNNVPANGTLRWAIEQADLAGGTDVINFSPSVFGTAQTITFGSFNGAIPMSATGATITVDGPGASLLTINGNNNGAVFEVDSGVTAAISGLTITGASLGGNGAVDDLGTVTLSNSALTGNTISGLYVAGTADVSDCIISGNNNFSGGGIHVVASGTATITGSTMSGNDSAGGGGLWSAGTTTVTNCTVTGNSSLGSGGGIYNSGQLTVKDSTITGSDGTGVTNGAGSAYISGSTISGNSGFINGGNFTNSYGATLTVTSCTVTGGTAIAGGGVYNGGMATITDCTIAGNTASGQGGGIVNGTLETKCVLILSDSTLSGNSSGNGDGGGLLTRGTSTLTDDTIAGNFGGGGVNNDGTATIVACTISGNTTAGSGGGLYIGGLGPNMATLDDTIVAGNASTQSGSAIASDIFINSGAVSGSFNLIGVGGAGGLVNGSAGNIVLTTLTGLGLAPLGDYGGPTETMAVEPASVAKGAGSRTIAGVTIPTTDQRGFPLDLPRPDIGAYQTQGSVGSLVVGVTTDTGQSAPAGELDLRSAVDLANSLGGNETITFDPTVFAANQTITLTQGPLDLTDTSGTITITGPAAGVTISGDGTSEVFQIEPGVAATMSGLTITQGSAASGGGLYNQGNTQLTDCTISANVATGSGGGLFNTGTITLTNCTLSGNSATGGGGLANSGTAELYACTLSGNTAAAGGGLENLTGAMATLEDTLVAANTTASGSASDIGGSNAAGVTGTYDLVGTGGSGGIAGSGDILLNSLAGLGLAPLANYGGGGGTIALLPGSPALGAGKAISGIVVDERGQRLDSPDPDIGAFQSQGFVLTPVTGSTPQGAVTGTMFALPLAVTVTANNAEEPVAGGVVTFIVDSASNGASATLSSATATIPADGTAQVTAAANAVAGSYTVAASARGAGTTDFALSNLLQPSFSGVVDQTISYGTASVTVAGTLTAGSAVPSPGNVTVTLDGIAQQAPIGADGAFTTTFTDTDDLTGASSPYTISLSFASNGLFASATATSELTVTLANPTVSVTDASGTYNGSPFTATVSVTGLSGVPSSTLEGVPVTATYYNGTYTSASQLAGLTPLPAAPGVAGDYTVLASFPGSPDYTSNTVVADFTVAQATPTVTVVDAGGTYNAAAFAASGTVTGVHGSGSNSLEGVSLSLAFYSGTYTTADQLSGLTPLSGAPSKAGQFTVLASFPGSADYSSAAAVADFNIVPAAPELTVLDGGGSYDGDAFVATSEVTGIDGSPGLSLEGVSPSSSYFSGTYTTTAQLAGLNPLGSAPSQVGSYTVLASFPGSTDYASATALANFTISESTPLIAWSPVASIAYGTALGNVQLDARASVPGTYSYSPAAGTLLDVGGDQKLSVTFTPQDTLEYATVTASVTITVVKAAPTLEVSDPGGGYNGGPFPASVAIVGTGENNTPSTSLQGVTPTVAYYVGSGTSGPFLGSTPPSAVGTYTAVASFAGTADYLAVQSAPVTFAISAGGSTTGPGGEPPGTDAATILLSSSAATAVYGQPITLVATVAAADTPTGTVTFFDDGTALATVALDSSGTAVLTTTALPTGAQSITATYNGNSQLSTAKSQSTAESVVQAATSIVLVPRPVLKKKTVKSEVLTADINPIAPGGGVPTGMATFELVTTTKRGRKTKTKTKVLGSAAVSGGSATLTFKPNLVLKQVITIIYSGGADFTASTLTAPKLSKKGVL